jgi:hypothetical protein
VGAGFDELPFGGDHVGLLDGVGGEAVLASEPAEAPAHRIADDPDPGRRALQPRQPVRRRLGDQVGPLGAGLHPGSSDLGVHSHAPHAGGVDEDTAVAGGGDTVSGGYHADAKTLLARQEHRGDDVRSPLSHDHECRGLVGVEVPRRSPLLIALIAGDVGVASQACSEPFERRTVDVHLHGNLLLFGARTRTA